MKRQRAMAAQLHPQRSSSNVKDFMDRFQQNQQNYYGRLLYQCRRDLSKHVKNTKKFEIQKQIRKVKETTLQKNGTDIIVSKQEKKLQQLKDFVIEPAIHECFRRLGILQLDPKLQYHNANTSNLKDLLVEPNETVSPHDLNSEPEPLNSRDEKGEAFASNVSVDGNADSVCPGTNNENGDDAWILDRIMKHRTMITALEHWNFEVTEYRRWSLRQQEQIDGNDSDIYERRSKKDRKSPKNSTTDATLSGSSYFVSLGGTDPEDSATPFSHYGPAGEESNIKKNRQGQRARRAKAAAIEAKKHGRVLRPEESLNWRKPKTQLEPTDRDMNSTNGRSKSFLQRASASQQSHTKKDSSSSKTTSTIPVEELHPSWQARKGQTEGIVAFQGKKITFDDE